MDLSMDLAIYFQVKADCSDDIDYKYQVWITRWIYIYLLVSRSKLMAVTLNIRLALQDGSIYLLVSKSKLMAVTSLGDDSTGSCFRRRWRLLMARDKTWKDENEFII
jgi:hypothetical protein